MRWFCTLLITFLFGFSTQAVEKSQVQVMSLNGLIVLRVEFDPVEPSNDSAFVSTDSGQKWKPIHKGKIDLLRVRQNQVTYRGEIPSRVRIQKKSPNDSYSQNVGELEFASGSFLFIFNELFGDSSFAKFPRLDGIIEETTARELIDNSGRRLGMYLFSIKTTTRASTWVVQQGNDWRASVIKFIFETYYQSYETSVGLKNGRYNNVQTLQVDGYTADTLDQSLAELWPSFDPASRDPKKKNLMSFMTQDMQSAIRSALASHGLDEWELHLDKPFQLKKIIRYLDAQLSDSTDKEKVQLIQNILKAFESRLVQRIQDEKKRAQIEIGSSVNSGASFLCSDLF